jgi:hypothetical protein
MQARLWSGVAALVALAVASAFAERRRMRRSDPDRVGVVPWLSVQLFALVAALIVASVALSA